MKEFLHSGELYLPMEDDVLRAVDERDRQYYFKERRIPEALVK